MHCLKNIFLIIILATISITAYAKKKTDTAPATPTPSTNNLRVTDLIGYKAQPEAVQKLIDEANKLSHKNLAYRWGSADPTAGGMDCSGTIQYLLHAHVQSVPRQADQMYRWVWQHGKFYSVNGSTFNSFEFNKLKPGDLLFWRDTYSVNRDPPITHVMLYLGKNKYGQRLMFGSANSGKHQGQKKYGVSVYDFRLSAYQGRFVGYGCIPQLGCDDVKFHAEHGLIG